MANTVIKYRRSLFLKTLDIIIPTTEGWGIHILFVIFASSLVLKIVGQSRSRQRIINWTELRFFLTILVAVCSLLPNSKSVQPEILHTSRAKIEKIGHAHSTFQVIKFYFFEILFNITQTIQNIQNYFVHSSTEDLLFA